MRVRQLAAAEASLAYASFKPDMPDEVVEGAAATMLSNITLIAPNTGVPHAGWRWWRGGGLVGQDEPQVEDCRGQWLPRIGRPQGLLPTGASMATVNHWILPLDGVQAACGQCMGALIWNGTIRDAEQSLNWH